MEKINFFKARWFVIVAVIIGEFFLLAGAFRAGTVVGFHKATYSYRWEENYENLFGGPRGMMRLGGGPMGIIQDFRGDNFMSGHGITGSILKIDGNTIIVKTFNNTERSLLVSSSTPIRKDAATLTVNDLRENDQVVAIGTPSTSGQIEIKFLRVLPSQSK